MILQQILELFDEELDRLQQLRSIVTGLGRPSILPIADALAAATDYTTTAALPPGEMPGETHAKRATRKKRLDSAARRDKIAPVAPAPRGIRSRRRALDDASALRGSIPAGPVVVSADRLREQTSGKKERPKPSPVAAVSHAKADGLGSLGSMIRALRLDTTP